MWEIIVCFIFIYFLKDKSPLLYNKFLFLYMIIVYI